MDLNLHIVKFKLIEFQGEPAIIFDDGDIILQTDSLGSFLMHVSILMPNCELPDTLQVSAATQKIPER